jgi:hypothetical protein
MEAAEVYARIDSLGDVPATLSRGSREKLAELYAGTGLQVLYEPGGSAAEISMRVNSVRVRGGNRTTVPRRFPDFWEISMISTVAREITSGESVMGPTLGQGSVAALLGS